LPGPRQPGVPTGQQPGVPTGQQPGARQPGVPTGQQPGVPTGQQPGVPTGQQPGVPTGQQPGVPTGQQPGVPGTQDSRIKLKPEPGSTVDTAGFGDSPVGLVPGTEGFIPIPNPLYFVNDVIDALGLGRTQIRADKIAIQDAFSPLFRRFATSRGLSLRDNHFLQLSSGRVQSELASRPDLQALVEVFAPGAQQFGERAGLRQRVVNQFLGNVAINGWSANDAVGLWKSITQ